MRNDSLGLAKQVGAGAGGLGTKVTAMEYFVPVEAAAPGANTEQMTAEETVGHPFPTDADRGTQHFEPSWNGKCRAASLPRLLSMFMGDPVTTTLDVTAKKHNFDPVARPTPRAHSILQTRKVAGEASIVDLLWDAIGTELELAVEPNDWITFDASAVAKEIDEAQPDPTVTADLTRRFPFYETKAYISIPSVAAGVEQEVHVGAFGLGYSLNVPTDDFVLGSRRLFRVQPGNRDASLTFTPKENISAYYRRALATDPEACKLRLHALGPIIAGTTRYAIEIIAHRLVVVEAPVDLSSAEPVTGVEITAGVSYDAAAGKFVEVNVTNTVAAY